MPLPATAAQAAVQQAVYEVLTGDATLMAMAAVHDYVPEDAVMPWVEVGEVVSTPSNSHDRFGRDQVITLHIWSSHRGFSEANAIVDRLHEVLDHQPLTVDGHHHVSTRFEFAQTLRDPEPSVRHVPVRFRIVTEQD